MAYQTGACHVCTPIESHKDLIGPSCTLFAQKLSILTKPGKLYYQLVEVFVNALMYDEKGPTRM